MLSLFAEPNPPKFGYIHPISVLEEILFGLSIPTLSNCIAPPAAVKLSIDNFNGIPEQGKICTPKSKVI